VTQIARRLEPLDQDDREAQDGLQVSNAGIVARGRRSMRGAQVRETVTWSTATELGGAVNEIVSVRVVEARMSTVTVR